MMNESDEAASIPGYPHPALPRVRRTGNELFHNHGADLHCSVLDFWQWSASGLLTNVQRGRVAEYLVARALGVADGTKTPEWGPYDVKSRGGITIEVRSAAYVQDWEQKAPSNFRFGIAASKFDRPEPNQRDAEPERHAQVYVFALLDEQDPTKVDPLDVGQWKFFVVPTSVLDIEVPNQKTIGLGRLKALKLPEPFPCSFDELDAAVAVAGKTP